MRFDNRYEIERAISDDTSRPTLVHAHYDLERKRLCATDGHMMAIIPVEPQEGEAAGPVSGESIKAARKATAKMGIAEIHANGALAVLAGPTFPRPRLDGLSFPPIDEVIPSYKKGDEGTVTIGLDVELLMGLARAIGAGGKKKGARLVYLTIKLPAAKGLDPDEDEPVLKRPSEYQYGDMLDPIIVGGGVTGEEIALLMPVRP